MHSWKRPQHPNKATKTDRSGIHQPQMCVKWHFFLCTQEVAAFFWLADPPGSLSFECTGDNFILCLSQLPESVLQCGWSLRSEVDDQGHALPQRGCPLGAPSYLQVLLPDGRRILPFWSTGKENYLHFVFGINTPAGREIFQNTFQKERQEIKQLFLLVLSMDMMWTSQSMRGNQFLRWSADLRPKNLAKQSDWAFSSPTSTW